MKLAWCWRCKARVPMFDEPEFALIKDAYRKGVSGVKSARDKEGRPLRKEDETLILRGLSPLYEQLTGHNGEVPRDVLKHRLSLVGPACKKCGKELRTSLARKCLECGEARN